MRTKILVDFVLRHNEPEESDWPKCAAELASEDRHGQQDVDVSRVQEVKRRCPGGGEQKEGAGGEPTLDLGNPGLIAAAIALKSGQSPAMATMIRNQRQEFRAAS